MTIIERIQHLGIIPVISIPQLEDALPLAEALLEGGLPCAPRLLFAQPQPQQPSV